MQNVGERVADYATALKKCAERCKFDTFLDQASRDRFVCGLKNRAIQKKLPTEKDLTWRLAIDIAHEVQSADKQANALWSEGVSNPVHKVDSGRYRQSGHSQQRRKERSTKPCFR